MERKLINVSKQTYQSLSAPSQYAIKGIVKRSDDIHEQFVLVSDIHNGEFCIYIGSGPMWVPRTLSTKADDQLSYYRTGEIYEYSVSSIGIELKKKLVERLSQGGSGIPAEFNMNYHTGDPTNDWL